MGPVLTSYCPEGSRSYITFWTVRESSRYKFFFSSLLSSLFPGNGGNTASRRNGNFPVRMLHCCGFKKNRDHLWGLSARGRSSAAPSNTIPGLRAIARIRLGCCSGLGFKFQCQFRDGRRKIRVSGKRFRDQFEASLEKGKHNRQTFFRMLPGRPRTEKTRLLVLLLLGGIITVLDRNLATKYNI